MKKFFKKLLLSIYITFLIVLGLVLFESEGLLLRILHTGILTASGILIYIIIETTMFKRKS